MEIKKDIPLAPLTTFKVGGPASYFVDVKNVSELKEAFNFADKRNLETFVLGGGSNIVVSDEGFDGLVIHINILGVIFSDNEVEVCAGESWDRLVEESVSRGHYALANLSSIPGSVGAAPVQNIGAYGVEVKNVIKSVEVFDRKNNKVKTLLNNDCKFGYRDSIFKNECKHLVITKVIFDLGDNKPDISYDDLYKCFEGNGTPTPNEVRDAIISIRSKKFPDLRYTGTAGSFFKNPVVTAEEYSELKGLFTDLPKHDVGNGNLKVPLGFILDRLGLKSEYEGGVEVYDKQALVFINKRNGTFKDTEVLSERIIKKVKEKTGIEIKKEVIFVK